MKILVTGAAGFIGFHLCQRLCGEGFSVIGLDNLNDYYDVNLKKARLKQLEHPQFTFEKIDIADRQAMQAFADHHQFDIIIHLAAQAGVRYSLENPRAYIDSNLVGFGEMLELARKQSNCQKFIYASSSSVYGANEKIPFSEEDNVDHPVSLYAATKKANELLAHSYAHLYQIPCIGLRFFTVYGPWGRPDMAYYQFSEKILAQQPIHVFNQGDMQRDFTYIDDIVEGLFRITTRPGVFEGDVPYRLYNIGRGEPVHLLQLIGLLEKHLGKKAIKQFHPMQPGDVPRTFADTKALKADYDYQPNVSLETGIQTTCEWFMQFQSIMLKHE